MRGATENEFRIRRRFEFDRFARRLESSDIPFSLFVRYINAACRSLTGSSLGLSHAAASRGRVTKEFQRLSAHDFPSGLTCHV